MSAHFRVALAANLSRAAATFDDLAKRAAVTDPLPRTIELEESQAQVVAGATIWDSVLRGLLNIPAIAALVGYLAAHGYAAPETSEAGHQCANLFHDVMCTFLYPEGEGLFPHVGFQANDQEAHRTQRDDAGEFAAMCRRQELHNQATGCRMLATIVEAGADGRYRTSDHLEELLGGLAAELERYADYVTQESSTGSDHESKIIAYVYQLRCYFNGGLPSGLDVLWAGFVDATRPYEELPEMALKIAEAMLSWIEDNAGHVLFPRCVESTFDTAGDDLAMRESGDVGVRQGGVGITMKTKGGAMNREAPFPYPYDSDLHWLWGWGERLRAFLADDKPPNKYVWIVFRPDRLACDAMMRFSISFPHIIKQLEDFLAFTEARYSEFTEDESDTHSVDLGNAMEALCERIRVGVKTIADAIPVSDSLDPTEAQNPSPSDLESGTCHAEESDSKSGQSVSRKPGHVFVSYCRKDKKWLDDLLVHLKPYCRDGSITAWSDRQISPGTQGHSEIQAAIAVASIAVLLVTPDFLASDYIHEHELAPLLQAAKDRGVRIVWIPVSACSIEKSPLHKLQAVINPETPLANMKGRRNAAWVAICKFIEQAAKRQ